MNSRYIIRKILLHEDGNYIPGEDGEDHLTPEDLMDYNIGKSILIGDIWYEVVSQDKDDEHPERSVFQLQVAEYNPPDVIKWAKENPLPNDGWVTFKEIADNVNAGRWGFQLKNERRGKQGWFGRESPRHIGKHDKDKPKKNKNGKRSSSIFNS